MRACTRSCGVESCLWYTPHSRRMRRCMHAQLATRGCRARTASSSRETATCRRPRAACVVAVVSYAPEAPVARRRREAARGLVRCGGSTEVRSTAPCRAYVASAARRHPSRPPWVALAAGRATVRSRASTVLEGGRASSAGRSRASTVLEGGRPSPAGRSRASTVLEGGRSSPATSPVLPTTTRAAPSATSSDALRVSPPELLSDKPLRSLPPGPQ